MTAIPSINSDMFININSIEESCIHEYFEKINDGEFQAAAELFFEQGILSPPFEKPLQGRESITQYLQKEALGMKFYPEYGRVFTSIDRESTLTTQLHYQIQGRVSTAWFTVNVSWWIKLNAAKEIMLVEVKLLSALHDLLSLNRNR
jgi:hypothetical protein